MKKLFALMLALMLALVGVSAVSAEAPAAEAPAAEASAAQTSSVGTISLGLELNAEAIAALSGATDETSAALFGSIVELINDMDIVMTSDGVDAEGFITLNAVPVAGMAVLKDTDNLRILSNLFPNYILKVDQQATGGIVPQISLDPEQMTAMAAPLTQFIGELQAKIGEPEKVEAMFFETPFTVKLPINLTTKEVAQMALTAAKELISQEGFTSLLEQIKGIGVNINFDASEIDAKLEAINSAKDEDLPTLDAAMYSNDAGDSMLFVINLIKGNEQINIKAGSLNGLAVSEVDVPGKMYFIENVTDAGMIMHMETSVQEGLAVTMDGTLLTSETGFSGLFTVKMNDTELGTVTLSGSPDGTLSGVFTTEGKTEISVTELQDAEKGEGFKKDVQEGVGAILGGVMEAYPGIAALFTMFAPQGGAATTQP